MDEIENKALKNLKKIRSNEKAFNYAYFHITKADIRKKIKEEILKKNETVNGNPNLSSTEKKRVFNIGNCIIKGGTEFYEKLINDIKKSEKKRYKENLNLKKKEQRKAQKMERKSSKIKMGIKLGLLGAAIGVSAYYIKEIYDTISKSQTFIKISKFLDKLKPISMSFNVGTSKIIDGVTSSFSIKTNNGEELSISDERREKNPVEEAAKTFDFIMTDTVMGKNVDGSNKVKKFGFDYFLNSVEEASSPLGHFISVPLFRYGKKLLKYIINSFKNPALLSAGWKEAYRTMVSFDKIESLAKNPLENTYATLRLRSEDALEKKRIEVRGKLETIFTKNMGMEGDGNKRHKVIVPQLYGGNVTMYVSNPDIVLSHIDKITDPNDPFRFIRILRKLKDEKIKIELRHSSEFHADGTRDWTNTILRYVVDGNKSVQPELLEFLGFSLNYTGTQLLYGPSAKSDKENLLNAINTPLSKELENLIQALVNERQLIGDLVAQKMYYDHFLLPKEIVTNILRSSNLDKNINEVSHAYLESEIYFNKNLKTKEKMDLIVKSYFTPEKNFFKNYILKLEKGTEKSFALIMSKINFFKVNISPFGYLISNDNFEEDSKLKNLLEKHYKNRDLLISETTASGSSIEMSYDITTQQMVMFLDKKIEFRKIKLEKLSEVKEKLKSNLIKMIEIRRDVNVYYPLTYKRGTVLGLESYLRIDPIVEKSGKKFSTMDKDNFLNTVKNTGKDFNNSL